MPSAVILYGPNWSAYTRTVRLTLIEKNVPHQLVDVNFASEVMPEAHWQRHPFGKVPALGHGDFLIYETAAICRYLDAAFTGPPLQPTRPKALGRMAQVIGILDAYLSQEVRMGYVNERLIKPLVGSVVDEPRVAKAHAAIVNGFRALANCVGDSAYLVSDGLTLADLHAIPLFGYLALTPGGNELIDGEPRLMRWWSRLRTRDSVLATEPNLAVFNQAGSSP